MVHVKDQVISLKDDDTFVSDEMEQYYIKRSLRKIKKLKLLENPPLWIGEVQVIRDKIGTTG